MQKEIRTICYDEYLHLEAYRFEGIVQSFPNHFHDYYVIGFIEAGTRHLSCKNKEYTVSKGNILLFNPNDNHSCTQCDGGTLDYRGLNISKETMSLLTEEVTGKKSLPHFSENVIRNEELNSHLRSLHQMIMRESYEFEKEEILLLFISLLIEQYGQPFSNCVSDYRKEIDIVCEFMTEHFTEHIALEDLCKCSNLSKSTLLRAFTKSKGITPYRYLQTIRISKAKKLLEHGASTVDAAIQTGFSDQSHFSNFFNMFIGLSPAAYRRIFREGSKSDE
ncbi:MAG: AraC family transcriptional regulator [Faecalibacterium sp.]|nr:AraC family transcriptional regulator [Ruminococcus sp.]MCM1392430.1 AraC family transcriptional regulator [Ruminococcus sp.]MCM1486386.1 AraC family transcriptional regulator [Faecalibacterium sp.]